MMSERAQPAPPNLDWHGSGVRERRHFRWNHFLWALIFPERNQRNLLTIPGLVLVGLALGIGSAAYNTSSNILFITLSLLLACLILSGVMSWLNLRAIIWRLLVPSPARAGQETPVTVELWNRKAWLPTFGLWFDVVARPVPTGPQRAEGTFRASSAEIRAALAKGDQAVTRATLPLRERLDPDGQARLDWLFTPQRRGIVRVELVSMGSLFPFGFLRKSRGARVRRELIVWPAPVEYRFTRAARPSRQAEGERVARPGAGNDLLALRRYQTGDSHRLVHWKASARLRQLMVRQFAAERAEGFFLWITTPVGRWKNAEQFELACSFAATWAEDLFTADRLTGAVINDREPIVIRRVRDLESFLDQLAMLEPDAGSGGPEVKNPPASRFLPSGSLNRRNVITFAPDGSRGVAAYVDGEKTATA